jgi:leucyl/phenylalanyl-tRNA--protein transferase
MTTARRCRRGLEPGTILAAYRPRTVPHADTQAGPIGWWSPDPRAVLDLDELTCPILAPGERADTRSAVDTAFDRVIRACGDPKRPKGWIEGRIIDATRACSISVGSIRSKRSRTAGLVGGLYGVAHR